MFYIVRNLETQVFFTHYEMDLTSDHKQIYHRLKHAV